MSANSPSEHYANHASCSAAPGMPSEEDIARAILENPPNRSWEPCKDSMRLVRDHTPTARAILSLIRAAFEAKEIQLKHAYEAKHRCNEDANRERASRLSAEAKLAQAVEALKAKERQITEWDHQEDASADEDIKALVAALQGRMSNEEIEGVFAEMKAIRARSASAAAKGEA